MKKTIQKTGLTLAIMSIIAFTAGSAMAQYGPRGGHKGDGYGKQNRYNRDCPRRKGKGFRGLAHLKAELKLTDAQVLKIMDIKHEFHKKVYLNRNNRTKILELKLEMRKKILRVLTREQRKKFEKMPKRRDRRPYRGMR